MARGAGPAEYNTRVDRLLAATARAERDHFWFRGFRRFVSPLLDEAASGRAGLRLLDCGCGTGSNLRVLLEPRGEAWGLDLTWTGLQFARRAGVTRAVQANAAAMPFPSAAFDIATSFDVLYCLPDEVEHTAVSEMWRVLKPGGAAIIHVPAMNVLRGNHSVLSLELRRYSRASLRTLVEHAGFRIERVIYTNASLFPVMLAIRGAQRLAGLAAAGDALAEITVPPAPVNAALSAVLAAEAAIARVVPMPFGSSLICLARKPA
jgi:ubiquinone/menaquinone biosynthesis C-methylase UbiE